MKKIGNSFDALQSIHDTLLDIEEAERIEQEKEKEELKLFHEQLKKEFNEKFGFKSFQDALDYIKTCNDWVGDSVSMYRWNNDKKLIENYHQESDEYDAWFGMTTEFLTEEEFLHSWDKVIENFKKLYNEDITFNEYGYIWCLHKNLTNEDYKRYRDVI